MIGEEVLALLYFAAPGVLTELYIRQYRPAGKRSEQFELYLFILASLVEWVLFYIMTGILRRVYLWFPDYIKNSMPQAFVHYSKYILMLVIIWACARIFLICNKMGTKKLLPLDTAWDSFFLSNPHVFMEIHLTNEKVIYGEYAGGSYASSDKEDKDIYLERIYETDQDGQLVFDEKDRPIEVVGNKGVLILGEQIQYIIFYEDEGRDAV